MELIIFAILSFALTFAGIKLFLGWLHKKQIFDIPNERSSHKTPTPVGGGIVIVIVTLAMFAAFLIYNSGQIPWGFIAGALIISVISWLDDLYSVNVIIRFLCHSVAAVLVIVNFGVYESFYIPLVGDAGFGLINYVIWFCWIVWLINAYNFMDGIDGIAGTQALTAAAGWFFVGYFFGDLEIQVFSLIIAFSSAAFLIFNWQPAKIFMGDVGSAFLGYTFAVLPLFFLTKTKNDTTTFLPFTGVLFVWLFVFDTIRTFLLRLMQGEPVWKAHRRHLYQQFVIKGLPHQKVTLLYGILSTVILFAAVFGIYSGFINDLWLVLIVAVISIALAVSSLFLRASDAN